MILQRKVLMAAVETLYSIKGKNIKCNVSLQYKILKLIHLLQDEYELTKASFEKVVYDNAERNENGEPITQEGAVKIQADKVSSLNEQLASFYKEEITIPDFYFTIDELEPLELTWSELDSLYIFVKN